MSVQGIHHASDWDTFDELTRSSPRVLVDFWGPQCAPCLALAPTLERLATEADLPLVKVEAPTARRLCMRLKVMTLPTLVLFREGVESARLSGSNLTAPQVATWLQDENAR